MVKNKLRLCRKGLHRMTPGNIMFIRKPKSVVRRCRRCHADGERRRYHERKMLTSEMHEAQQ